MDTVLTIGLAQLDRKNISNSGSKVLIKLTSSKLISTQMIIHYELIEI